MGIDEINAYINEDNTFPNFLLRNLSATANKKKIIFKQTDRI